MKECNEFLARPLVGIEVIKRGSACCNGCVMEKDATVERS